MSTPDEPVHQNQIQEAKVANRFKMCCFKNRRGSIRALATFDIVICIYFICKITPIMVWINILRAQPMNIQIDQSVAFELFPMPTESSKIDDTEEMRRRRRSLQASPSHEIDLSPFDVDLELFQPPKFPDLEKMDQPMINAEGMKIRRVSKYRKIIRNKVKPKEEEEVIIPFGKGNEKFSKALLKFESSIIFGYMTSIATIFGGVFLLLGCKRLGANTYLFVHLAMSGLGVILALFAFSKVLRPTDANLTFAFRKLSHASFWNRKQNYQSGSEMTQELIDEKIHDSYTAYFTIILILYMVYKIVEELWVLAFICDGKRIQRLMAMQNFQDLLFVMNRRNNPQQPLAAPGSQQADDNGNLHILDRPPSYNSLGPLLPFDYIKRMTLRYHRNSRVADSSPLTNTPGTGNRSNTPEEDSDEKPPPYESIANKSSNPDIPLPQNPSAPILTNAIGLASEDGSQNNEPEDEDILNFRNETSTRVSNESITKKL